MTAKKQVVAVRAEPILVGETTAAALLDIAPSTFRKYVSAGDLPRPRMLGGRALWLVAELQSAANGLQESTLLPPSGCARND